MPKGKYTRILLPKFWLDLFIRLSRKMLVRPCMKMSTSVPKRFSSTLTLYGFHLSQPTRAVAMLLQANNIPYELKKVNATKGETRTAEFLAINPTGAVPYITDDKVGGLAEHGAILTYLCELHKLTSWYPNDPVIRGRIQFWINWNHTNTRHGTMGILVGHLFPDKFAAGVDAATKKYTRSIKFIEKQLVPGKYLAGTDKPSIADLSVITEIDQLNKEAFGFFDFTPYPKVSDWLKLVADNVSSYKAVYDPVILAGQKAKKHAAGEQWNK